MPNAVIAIHGGAGALSREVMSSQQEENYLNALRTILFQAQTILNEGGSALDAVTLAVTLFEDNPLFNAGYGAVYTSQETHELDASIMDGCTLQSGAIASVNHIKNPIRGARAVMEKSDHVFFCGRGAENFLTSVGLETVPADYFSTQERLDQLHKVKAQLGEKAVLDHDGQYVLNKAPLDESKKMGTVGAVALDCHGHLAAATSTGGITNKQAGRIGDSPIIGAGCYANDKTCAVSCTGTGEMFIRAVAAYDVSAQMEYAGLSLKESTDNLIFKKLPLIHGVGGLIAVDHLGNVCMPFNSEGMYRGYAYVGEEPVVGIYRDEEVF